MNLEELLAREQIRQTMANYTLAGDRLDIDGYLACFTQDGAIEGEGWVVQGHPAIREWLSANEAYQRPDGSRPSFVRHHLTTCSIELTSPTTAKARSYWQV